MTMCPMVSRMTLAPGTAVDVFTSSTMLARVWATEINPCNDILFAAPSNYADNFTNLLGFSFGPVEENLSERLFLFII